MSDVSDILSDAFDEQWLDHGSKTCTYAGQTINAVWNTRTRGLNIEEGPKAIEDSQRVATKLADWTTVPTEGKIIVNPEDNTEWRVIHRTYSGPILAFTLGHKAT